MVKLPVISGDDLVKALKRFGYEVDHQTGSHVILRNTEPPYRRLTVPKHKAIAKGTLKSILRHAGIINKTIRCSLMTDYQSMYTNYQLNFSLHFKRSAISKHSCAFSYSPIAFNATPLLYQPDINAGSISITRS
ncbi:MAG: hypothetical protein B6D57_00635 [Candidatus Coatesbacteria bacterium 4484_99]|uniref:Addiction module toxin, HicA family n=1 Tax=Candidatus Coatesbacteria bacterium 4484_99 TaxID=1970774 RepID=A0A1W9S318_9BACT|nr:MAG: hypothetical protein B6D57_00635 [Candidatus Coatesbacteria bacterium 4484_99]